MNINNVDICCGLGWGDEAKGKIVSQLIQKKKYDFVCRWCGGSNAGHTIYVNDLKYHTHIIPCGIFYNIKSYIGPDCYININDFLQEINYLKNNGFDTSLVKISPNTHIITYIHKQEDIKNYKKQQGSTGKGIAPCAKDKFARKGIRVKDYTGDELNEYLLNEELYGDILCEGSQGFWLDINYGNYPFVTSSHTLPYSACSLGFPPQKIRDIYGAIKIYDTRVGIDSDFSEKLNDDPLLNKIAVVGDEFGTTTGRMRKVNWLNIDKLIQSINISGTTIIIISKIDILEKINFFKYIFNDTINEASNMNNLQQIINNIIKDKCKYVKQIIYSDNPKIIKEL